MTGTSGLIQRRRRKEGRIMPTESLSTPIKEFMRSCEVLLSEPINRETLTEEEREIIKLYLESLKERFFTGHE
jgi:hypothetical protein